jgi:hypothetical protein
MSVLKTLSKEEKLAHMRRRWSALEEAKCDAVIVPTRDDVTEEIENLASFGGSFEETEKRREAGVINSDEL